jgi:prophage regulatory protein
MPATNTAAELDRFLSTAEVLQIAGFSKTTLWREVRAKRFPPPVRIASRRVGFDGRAVQAWRVNLMRGS